MYFLRSQGGGARAPPPNASPSEKEENARRVKVVAVEFLEEKILFSDKEHIIPQLPTELLVQFNFTIIGCVERA